MATKTKKESKAEEVTSLRLLGDRVLVEPDAPAQVTPGGIVLPDVGPKQQAERGLVIRAGATVKDLQPGARVLFPQWHGTRVKLDDTEYLLMKEEDIQGVFE